MTEKTLEEHRCDFESWFSYYTDNFARFDNGDYIEDNIYYAWAAYKQALGITEHENRRNTH